MRRVSGETLHSTSTINCDILPCHCTFGDIHSIRNEYSYQRNLEALQSELDEDGAVQKRQITAHKKGDLPLTRGAPAVNRHRPQIMFSRSALQPCHSTSCEAPVASLQRKGLGYRAFALEGNGRAYPHIRKNSNGHN